MNTSGISYAGIASSTLLLYQNENFKESLTLPSAIGSHTRVATVCDSTTQYVLYTDSAGVLQIASVSLTPGVTDVETYAVPDLIPVTISGVSVADKTYDGSAASYTGTPSAVETASGDPATISQYTYSWYDVTNDVALESAPVIAGSYKLIVAVDENDGTYSGSTEIPFTISPKALTISGVVAGNRAYNGTTTVTISNGSLNGVVSDDEVIPVVPVSGTIASAAVGDDKPVTINTITLSGSDAANYTLTQPTGITVDISKATISISGVAATNRAYNGTTTVAITGGTLNGVFGDDDVSPVVPATGSIASATVGDQKSVTLATITLTGDDAANYSLAQPLGLKVDIDPATLTISGVVATDRDYNGNTVVAITGGTLNGIFGDDEVSPEVPATATVASATAAKDKAVTLSTITLTGADAANYTLTQPTGLTVNIDPAPLTISGVVAGNRAYNATTTVTISNGTLNGVVGEDEVIPVVPVSGTIASAAAGDDKPVTIAAITLTGDDATNYMLTQPTGITVDISKAPLTISGVAATDRDYNGTTTVAITGGTLNGVYAVDEDDVAPIVPATGKVATAAAAKDKAVTLDTITLDGNAAANYALTQPTGLTVNIDPATLTISGVAATDREYNGLTSVAITGGTLNGIFGEDEVSPVVPATGSVATADAWAGKTVTLGEITLSGTDSTNYTLTQPTGITVDIIPATLTISGISATDRNYNGSTTVAITGGTLNGVVGTDDVSPSVPATGTVATAAAGEDKAVTVGTIDLVGTAVDNYSLTQPTGITVDIAPAPLTITGKTVEDKTYNGSDAATVSSVTFSGLQNGETLTGAVDYSVTASFSDSTAGVDKDVTGTVQLLATAKANNYSLADGSISDTATINKATGLIATEPADIEIISDLVKSYKYELNSIELNKTDMGTVTYSLNLLTGDDIFDSDPAVDGSDLDYTSAKVTEGTATQTINIHSQNYQDITVDLNFVLVDRASVIIRGVTVDDKTYDGTAIAYSGTPVAEANDETVTIDQYTYTWYEGATLLASAPKDAGSYTLKVAVAGDNEEYVGETAIDFTISKKSLTVKPMDKTIYTNAAFPTLEVDYVGLVNGEAAADVISFDTALTMEIQDGSGSPLADSSVNGDYPIVFTNDPGYDSDNYTVVRENGTLTIESEVTVTIETEGDTTTVVPETEVNGGFASVVLNEADLEAILEELDAEDGSKVIIAPETETEIDGIEVEMLREIAAEMADRDAVLVIATPIGDIILGEAALEAIAATEGDTLSLSIIQNDDGTITIELKVDDTVLEDVGCIKVALYLALDPGYVPVVVEEDESETIIKKSFPTAEGFIAILDGSATVKVIDNASNFNDVGATHWARNAVAFARSHELFFGTSDSEFSPNMAMNRAMFTTVLYRLEGCPPIEEGSDFIDVPAGIWYEDGVNWAAQNGIVNGTGNGKFEPMKGITREEMAVIIYRYCNAMGYDTSVRGNIDGFVDGAQVSTWARDAMSFAVGAGLISGKGHNDIDPQAGATRAEVATILQRMIGVIVQ